MAQELVVKIIGDATSLDRAMKKSAKATATFSGQIEKTSKRTRSAFTGIAGSLGLAFGAAGVVRGIQSTVSAASDLEQQVSKTDVVFGKSAANVQAWSKTLATSFGLSRREALTTASGFGALFAPLGITGKEAAKQSKDLTELGADLASFYNTDVQSALEALRSGLAGEAEPLRKYGILISETRVQQEALIQTGKKNVKSLTSQDKVLARIALIYKDSAQAQGDFARTSDTLANRLKIAQAQFANVQAQLGAVLIPILTEVVKKFSDWISNMENQKSVLDAVKGGVEVATSVFNGMKSALDKINSVTGSTKDTFKLLLDLFIAFKALKLAAYIGAMATQMGLFAAASKGAAGKVGAARAAGAGAAGGAVAGGAARANPWIALAIATIAAGHLLGVDKRVMRLIRRDTAEGPRTTEDIIEWNEQRKREAEALRDAIRTAEDIPDPARLHQTAIARRTLAAAKEAARIQKEIADAISKARRAANEAFRQERQDRAAFAVERAGATETLADDLAALNKYNALLLRRIRGGHATLELEREQFQVQQEIADVLKQQAEKRAEQRETRQFRILGFGPGGADLVPTAATLRKQLGKAEQALQGTFLDTKKTRSLVARIRKVLADGVGGISEDVRRVIQGLIDDLRQMQDKSKLDLDRWQTAGRGQFVFAATGASRPINVNVQIDGKTVAKATAKHNENELGRRHKQRSHSRRTR